MILKAEINGSMVGDIGGSTGAVYMISWMFLKEVVMSVHRGSRNRNTKRTSSR
jgi:hypothetical protein